MKKVVLFLTVFSFVFSQTFGWDDGGVPVRQGAHIEWSRTGDVGDNGNMILGWSDTRSGNRDIYAQKVDADGNELWGDDGLLVVGYAGRQEDPVFISDDNGGVYVIWSDFRNQPISDGQPYAQHITSDGTLSWDGDGIPLSDDKLTEYTLNMCKDGNGGVYALWKKKSSSHFASYMNISNSEPSDEVEVISDDWSHTNPSLETAGSGGAAMVWADERNADKDIYGQRLGFDGTNVVLEWETIEDENEDGVDDYPNGGIPIVTATGDQSSQKVTYYSEDYTVFVWQDERYGNPDIFATFLDINGAPSTFYGDDGLAVVSSHDNDGSQQAADNLFQHKKPRAKADENGAYVIWNDFRADPSGDIYIQKITHENNGVWDTTSQLPLDGIAISEEYGEQSNSRLTLDGNSGVYVVWENYNSNEEKDIKIKHLDSDGNSTYDSEGLSICSTDKDQISPLVRKDGNGGAFSVWQDHREGSIGLYTQHINVSGVASMPEGGVKLFYGIDYHGQLYNDEDPLQLTPKTLYLGDDQTLLFWEDHRNGNQSVDGVSISTSYVYAELINGNFGNTGTNNGEALSVAPVQSKPSIKSYDNGYLYHFIGQDIGSGENILSLEYLDDNFTSINDEPVSVDGTDWANQKNFLSGEDIDGNRFVVYAREMWDPSSIWLQIYNQSGAELLSSPENIVSNIDGENYYPREMFQNPAGGMVLVYDQNEADIRVIGIDNDGSIWDDEVSIIENSEGQQFQDAVATNDGIFITWKDSRNGHNDIFGQHISFEGNVLSSSVNGISLCEEANDQSGSSVAFVSTTNTATTCWEDFRNGSHWDAYCRDVNLNSHVVDDEFVLSDALGDQMNPFLYTSLTNTVLAVWEDFRNDTHEYSDIYFQELINGEASFTSNGEVVCDGFHNQVNPKIDLLSDQSEVSYLIYWDDMRSSGKEDLINVFAQKLVKLDCLGSNNGTAWINNCGDCIVDVEDTCVQGCDGNWTSDGSEVMDLGCGCGEDGPISYFIDNDGDGLGAGASFSSCDAQQDNWVTNDDDDNDECTGIIDDCNVCDGNNLAKDCAGDCFGIAIEDDCGICDLDSNNNNTTCSQDCNDEWGGTNQLDNCGVCDDDITNNNSTCEMDCSGEWGGSLVNDECGWCGGDGCHQGDCETYPSDLYDCEGVMLSLGESIPSEFGLKQNYPNPFNPSTTINFSIPEFSTVSISIYNVNGQKVKSLIQNTMSPGYHQINWYGDDDYGISVSNGIYFYIMETSNFVEKRKMLYIK
ncbi:MAG: T9SS type A sorting domain-containing protein [Candidatus Marinimicrobia bacterium]|nr:T9SS type A sorting domain-containing protein [Candidatus Neomarinimicrobiota bacterium]